MLDSDVTLDLHWHKGEIFKAIIVWPDCMFTVIQYSKWISYCFITTVIMETHLLGPDFLQTNTSLIFQLLSIYGQVTVTREVCKPITL